MRVTFEQQNKIDVDLKFMAGLKDMIYIYCQHRENSISSIVSLIENKKNGYLKEKDHDK